MERSRGVDLVAEYWPDAEDAAVVSILRSDRYDAPMEVKPTWGACFDSAVVPAISAQEGLKIGRGALSGRQV